jgi:hypothetical protein
LSSPDPNVIRYSLEAVKKICKKYRYMFRSDNLYSEMNYIIDALSTHLLTQANVIINSIDLLGMR